MPMEPPMEGFKLWRSKKWIELNWPNEVDKKRKSKGTSQANF